MLHVRAHARALLRPLERLPAWLTACFSPCAIVQQHPHWRERVTLCARAPNSRCKPRLFDTVCSTFRTSLPRPFDRRDRSRPAMAQAQPSPSNFQRLRRTAHANNNASSVDGEPDHGPDQRFARIELPGGHARFSSIAWPLIGVLVLVASWTVGVSYYFHYRSSEALFLAEQRAKADRAAALIEAAIANDLRGVDQTARSLAERPDLAAALARNEPEETVRNWAHRSRRTGGSAAVEIYGASGGLLERVGNPEQQRLGAEHKLATVREALAGRESVEVLVRDYGLTLRAAAPVESNRGGVGALIAGGGV